jgi:hypothetical protein
LKGFPIPISQIAITAAALHSDLHPSELFQQDGLRPRVRPSESRGLDRDHLHHQGVQNAKWFRTRGLAMFRASGCELVFHSLLRRPPSAECRAVSIRMSAQAGAPL